MRAGTWRRWRSLNTITWSRHSRRIEPISLSAYPFCQGERGDVGRSRMPICESACDLTPNRLPTVTLVGHTINSSIQCVAMRGVDSDLDADRAPDPTPNNTHY